MINSRAGKVLESYINRLEEIIKLFQVCKEEERYLHEKSLGWELSSISKFFSDPMEYAGITNSEVKVLNIKLRWLIKALKTNLNKEIKDKEDAKVIFDQIHFLDYIIEDKMERWANEKMFADEDDYLPNDKRIVVLKKELAALEIENQNYTKSTGCGISTFLFVLAGIIILVGLSGGGSLVLLAIGALFLIAGFYVSYKSTTDSSTKDGLNKKILDIKNKIIDLENS